MLSALAALVLLVEGAVYVLGWVWFSLVIGWPTAISIGVAVAIAAGWRLGHTLLTVVISRAFGGEVSTLSPVPARGWFRMVGLELAASTAQFSGLLLVERWLGLRDAVSRIASDPPVLFVHGFICNAAYWWPMLRHLRRRGWRSLYTMNLEPLFARLETYVPQVAARVDAILERTGADRVIIVAHSMGGLVARAYAATEHGSSHVRKLVTLGSPHHGTLLAYATRAHNALQMRPGSRFLRDLLEQESVDIQVPITSIWSHDDNIVVPQASARLEHSRSIEVAGVMHVSMSFAPEIHALVLSELEAERVTR